MLDEKLLKRRIQIVESDLEWTKILYNDSVLSGHSIQKQFHLKNKVQRFSKELRRLNNQQKALQKMRCKRAKQKLVRSKK
ncbi:MAG: hypothetical protein KGV50_02490 [Gammaproteobacteria bacterium]|nr:hypothetical protein [Gammaproteobacteria bacterium]